MTLKGDFGVLLAEYKKYPTSGRLTNLLALSKEEVRNQLWLPLLARLQAFHAETGVIVWNEDGIYAPSNTDPLEAKNIWSSDINSELQGHLQCNGCVGYCLGCEVAMQSSPLLRWDVPTSWRLPNAVLLDGGMERRTRWAAWFDYWGPGLVGIHDRCLPNYQCGTCRRTPDLVYSVIRYQRGLPVCPKCSDGHPLLFKHGKLNQKLLRDLRRNR